MSPRRATTVDPRETTCGTCTRTDVPVVPEWNRAPGDPYPRWRVNGHDRPTGGRCGGSRVAIDLAATRPAPTPQEDRAS